MIRSLRGGPSSKVTRWDAPIPAALGPTGGGWSYESVLRGSRFLNGRDG
ncbi:MAG: hypothetical protein ABH969_12885 [Pseudomonadota bacterium]